MSPFAFPRAAPDLPRVALTCLTLASAAASCKERTYNDAAAKQILARDSDGKAFYVRTLAIQNESAPEDPLMCFYLWAPSKPQTVISGGNAEREFALSVNAGKVVNIADPVKEERTAGKRSRTFAFLSRVLAGKSDPQARTRTRAHPPVPAKALMETVAKHTLMRAKYDNNAVAPDAFHEAAERYKAAIQSRMDNRLREYDRAKRLEIESIDFYEIDPPEVKPDMWRPFTAEEKRIVKRELNVDDIYYKAQDESPTKASAARDTAILKAEARAPEGRSETLDFASDDFLASLRSAVLELNYFVGRDAPWRAALKCPTPEELTLAEAQ